MDRLAAAEDLDDRDPPVARDVVDRVDSREELRDARIDMGLGHPDELGVLVAREIDVAAVGDARNDELGHAPQELLVVERLGQLLRRLEQEREPGTRPFGFVLRLRPLDHRCEVVGDRPREQHFALTPAVRRVAVEHESAELLPASHERDEGQRGDPFLAHDPLERRLEAAVGEILHENGLRVRGVGRPRRAPFGGGAVAVGEAAPRVEAEHAVVVTEQD